MQKTIALNSFFPFLRTSEKIQKYKEKPVLRLTTQRGTKFAISVVLAAANMVIIFSYLMGVNGYASSGYEIHSLQKRISELGEQNKQINLKVAEVSSVVSIQSDYLTSRFVSAGSVKFIQSSQFSKK